MKRRYYLLIFLLFSMLFMSIPIGDFGGDFAKDDLKINEGNFEESGILADAIYNVTYANVTYGTNTTNIWESGEMDNRDNVNASFVEQEYMLSEISLLGDAWTDSVDYWNAYYRLDNLETVSDAYIGSTSIRAQFTTQSGVPILRFDNNTDAAAALNVVDMEHFNFSMKSTSSTTKLQSVIFYNTVTDFYEVIVGTVIPTTWTVYDFDRTDYISHGDILPSDLINWISFRFEDPVNNEWIYLDAPMFYSQPYINRLGISFNFTTVAPFDNYALNTTLSSNTTSEFTITTNVYDYETTLTDVNGGGWNNFSIELNASRIKEDGFVVVFVNSTDLDDLYLSTLDIDFFQIYAWNETDIDPYIRGASLVNPDNGNDMYAGYKNYTFTVNVTDENGFDDIHYVRLGLENTFLDYYWKVGWFEDNNTFIEEKYPGNITLQTSLCSNVSSGNNIDLVFSILVEIVHPSDVDTFMSVKVNDTDGDEYEYHSGIIDVVSDASISGSFSDTRGNGGSIIYATGNVYYYNTTVGLASDYYDVWCYNTQGYTNYSDATIGANGEFNITVVTTTNIGMVEYELSVSGEGEGTTGSDYSAVDVDIYYISDRLVVQILTSGDDIVSGTVSYLTWSVTYEYDGTPVTSYTMIISEDGAPIAETFNENNAEYVAIRYDENSAFTVSSIIDNVYGITDFTANTVTISWSGAGSGVISDSDTEDNDVVLDKTKFGSHPLDWVFLGAGLIAIGYMTIFGIGPYEGIQGRQANALFKSIKKWVMENIPILNNKSSGRRSGLSDSRSSISRRYKIKLRKSWKLPSKPGWPTGGRGNKPKRRRRK